MYIYSVEDVKHSCRRVVVISSCSERALVCSSEFLGSEIGDLEFIMLGLALEGFDEGDIF